MRKSLKKHVLAVAREITGLKQFAFADIVGCSLSTIQSVEVGRLKLSKGLASRIEVKTGINSGWLLENDPTKPPIDLVGEPYSREKFDRVRELIGSSAVCFIGSLVALRSAVYKLGALSVVAAQRDQTNILAYRLNTVLDDILDEFKIPGNFRVQPDYVSDENPFVKNYSEFETFVAATKTKEIYRLLTHFTSAMADIARLKRGKADWRTFYPDGLVAFGEGGTVVHLDNRDLEEIDNQIKKEETSSETPL